MELSLPYRTSPTRDFVDARRCPRYKLAVQIRVYARNSAVVRGNTVDISESGISALLRDEIPVGEIVRLECSLPSGEIEALAMVRQRNAFRYGFQFVDASVVQETIAHTCRQLAVEQSVTTQP